MDQRNNNDEATDDLYRQRLNICRGCKPYLIVYPIPIVRTEVWQCGACKCILQLKARFRSQHCPIKKW
jgi:hypothetical protein